MDNVQQLKVHEQRMARGKKQEQLAAKQEKLAAKRARKEARRSYTRRGRGKQKILMFSCFSEVFRHNRPWVLVSI